MVYVIRLIVLLLFFGLSIQEVVALQQETNNSYKQQITDLNRDPSEFSGILPVNPQITSMVLSLDYPSKNSVPLLLENFLNLSAANPAEEYLILILQLRAQIDLKVDIPSQNNENIVEQLLTKTEQLSLFISEQQLAQPAFMKWYHVLADYYVQQGQFEQAVNEKNKYLDKYYIYLKNKRLSMIEVLGRSFEMKDKKATNALLESQNQIKVNRFADIQKQKSERQYQLTIIICSAIVFSLLFFKQLALRNKLLIQHKTDVITGLVNRNEFFKQGKNLVKTHEIEASDLSILIVDIDHFKKINDNFGYEVGDSILKEISHLIKESMRSRDLLSRIGTDHFSAILPFANQHKAKAIAMRIKTKIGTHNFSSLMVKQKVTVSIGLASLSQKTLNIDSLFSDADNALYYAKEQGRDTVVHSKAAIGE
jgi:diguanylate cyclase (GGDEF)-like protein